MKRIIIIIFVMLAGCANMQSNLANRELRNYMDQNAPLARAGSMKWSDYYTGLYDLASKHTNVRGAGTFMEITNNLIGSAYKFEDGKITLEEFKGKQREAEALLAQSTQAEMDADTDRRMRAYSAWKAANPTPTYRAPTTTNCYKVGNTVSCNSY